MHIRTAGVIALSVAASWLACRKASAPPRPTLSSSAPAPKASTADAKTARVDPLCRGRPRCSVSERRPAGNSDAGEVVIVRLAAAVDAATDEERCERREYWLERPAGDLLLAVDCAAQWGAENAGPASLSLAGNTATFRYVEFLADDACEIVEATLRLPQGRIGTHTRHFGTVVGNQCRPSRKVAPVPAPGCGTPDSPVLVLHRP